MSKQIESLDTEKLNANLARQLSPLSRRDLFSRAFLFGATAAVGAGVAACSPKVVRPEGTEHMSDGEIALFQKLIVVFLPLQGTKYTPVEKVPMMRNIDKIFKTLHPNVRKDLGMGLKLFQYGSIFIGMNFTAFHNLSDQAATEYCEKWLRGGNVQRAIFGALKQFTLNSYWSDSVTWGPIDYDGPLTKKNGIPSLGNAPLPT